MSIEPSYLKQHFLIAMPHMADPNFAQTVTYLVEHNEQGAMGLVINRPNDLSLADVLEQLRPDDTPPALCQSLPIYAGGPVQTDRGFVLHEPMHAPTDKPGETVYASTMTIPGGLEMTTSKDVLEALSMGAGPRRVLVSLGYSAWGEGQLESELSENSWLTVDADRSVIFDTPVEQRYDKALGLLGVEAWMLSPDAGHA